jgi:hypothetical protein
MLAEIMVEDKRSNLTEKLGEWLRRAQGAFSRMKVLNERLPKDKGVNGSRSSILPEGKTPRGRLQLLGEGSHLMDVALVSLSSIRLMEGLTGSKRQEQ